MTLAAARGSKAHILPGQAMTPGSSRRSAILSAERADAAPSSAVRGVRPHPARKASSRPARGAARRRCDGPRSASIPPRGCAMHELFPQSRLSITNSSSSSPSLCHPHPDRPVLSGVGIDPPRPPPDAVPAGVERLPRSSAHGAMFRGRSRSGPARDHLEDALKAAAVTSRYGSARGSSRTGGLQAVHRPQATTCLRQEVEPAVGTRRASTSPGTSPAQRGRFEHRRRLGDQPPC